MTEASLPFFNLLDEPWIPVRTLHGESLEVGLTELFQNAGDFRSIEEASPPNLIALHRLLLAILHRALTLHYGPWKTADRARWFREGLPEGALHAYLEGFRERFWVFHTVHPFMQVAVLAEAEETKDKTKPWTQLVLEATSGNSPTIFDHTLDEAPRDVPVPVALRSMLGYLQFTPGGLIKCIRGSDKSGPLSNTAAILPVGATIRETLLLCLHPYDVHNGEDKPTWEMSPTTLAQLQADATLATGPNDRYTRRSRAVLLLRRSGESTILEIRFAAGLALDEDPKVVDPMACHRIRNDGKTIRISFTEGRSTWRDLPSIVPDPSGSHALPAPVLAWASGLEECLGNEESDVHLLVAGLASDQAKLLRWRLEGYVLPRALLMGPEAAQELRSHVGFAEEVFGYVRGFSIALLTAGLPSPEHKDTKARARELFKNTPAESTFFSAAERALPHLLQQIAMGDIDAAHQDWRTALVDAAEAAWATVRQSLGSSPKGLRADARTYPAFRGYLKQLLPAVNEQAKENQP